MSERITRDTGRWTPVPEWVMQRGLSTRAFRLYCELGLLADYDTGEVEASHAYFAARMKCSKDTVQRAQSELEDRHCIYVERRRDERGEQLTNRYTVFTVDPIGEAIDAIRGSRKSAATQPQNATEGSRTDAAHIRTTTETKSSSVDCERCHGTNWYVPDVDDRHAPAIPCDHRVGALVGGTPVKENA